MNTEAFFALARERYEILLRRRAGEPKPWTTDEILRQFKFCNVFREDDATTIWIRENIREPLRKSPKVFQAMLLARWFNRISTLEVLKDLIISGEWTSEKARELLQGVSPIFTAAYLIRSPKGVDKLTGVLGSIEEALPIVNAKAQALLEKDPQATIEELTDWLALRDGIGHFMAYEVTSDLRHTWVLEDAPDIMTWANPGPGCELGIRRLIGTPAGGRTNMISIMQELLAESQDPENWPEEWPAWEMREVEHILCEYEKYGKTKAGEGTPKQLFDGGGVRTIMYGQGRAAPQRRVVDPTEAFIQKKLEVEIATVARKREAAGQSIIAALAVMVSDSKVDPTWLPYVETVVLNVKGREIEFPVSPPQRLPAIVEEGVSTADIKVSPLQGKTVDEYLDAQELLEAKEAKLREALAALE